MHRAMSWVRQGQTGVGHCPKGNAAGCTSSVIHPSFGDAEREAVLGVPAVSLTRLPQVPRVQNGIAKFHCMAHGHKRLVRLHLPVYG